MQGHQYTSGSDYQHWLETMLPLSIRGPVKAMRYATEGNIDRRTKIVINDEVSAGGVLGQILGFSSSEVRLLTEGKWAIYKYNKERMNRCSTLLTMFALAKMNGDNSGVRDAREAIQKFNEKNPERRIKASDMANSVRSRTMGIKRAEDGIYLPRKCQDANEVGRFARD